MEAIDAADEAHNSQAKRRGRGSGRPFAKGQSGNPGGRPKGIPTFNVQRIIGKVLIGKQPLIEAAILAAFQAEAQTFRGLELAAKLNREIQGDALTVLPAAAVQFNLVVQGAPASAPVLVEHPPLQFASLAVNGSTNGHSDTGR